MANPIQSLSCSLSPSLAKHFGTYSLHIKMQLHAWECEDTWSHPSHDRHPIALLELQTYSHTAGCSLHRGIGQNWDLAQVHTALLRIIPLSNLRCLCVAFQFQVELFPGMTAMSCYINLFGPAISTPPVWLKSLFPWLSLIEGCWPINMHACAKHDGCTYDTVSITWQMAY